ncbi:MAG: hypothetical protein RQ731_09685 [Anaerosomatales bacterium]|nr:hypothetical protein [Anaerosomatales bacterium]
MAVDKFSISLPADLLAEVDGIAPALAEVLGAPLYSADARAHKTFPGAEIIG